MFGREGAISQVKRARQLAVGNRQSSAMSGGPRAWRRGSARESAARGKL